MKSVIIDRVVEELETFPSKLQHQVLEFIQSLKFSRQNGIHGKRLLRFAGAILFEDLQIIGDTIEAGCEQVDHNEC